jgi:hypothetical protein
MAVESKHLGLIAGATLLLLAACSAREPVAGHAVHASAAQRIELGAVPGSPARLAPGAAQAAGEAAGALAAARSEPIVAEEIHLPDGTVGVKVARQFFHTIIACRQPDGTFSTNCPANTGVRP